VWNAERLLYLLFSDSSNVLCYGPFLTWDGKIAGDSLHIKVHWCSWLHECSLNVNWRFTDWCSSLSIDRTSGATHVAVVLNTLTAPPFEPVVMESLCVLSLKAMLLFISTSVKRIGHLQAL